jgi:hypothetical protein
MPAAPVRSGSPSPSASPPSADPPGWLRHWRFAAIAVLTLLVSGFYLTTLANNQEVSRLDIVESLPDLLLLNLPGEDASPRPTLRNQTTSGWHTVVPRLDIIGIAAAIWLGAWSLGRLTLRAIGLLRRMEFLERQLFAAAAGIVLWSVIVLAFGAAGVMSPWLFRGLLLAVILGELITSLRERKTFPASGPSIWNQRFFAESYVPLIVGLAVTPFLMAMLLAATQPTQDFDVREYHFEGPKEYYLAGRIQFLPHNVYTSFPFLTEMFHLLGMILRGDWYRGALIGQTVLMGFVPLAALGLLYAGKRWFTSRSAWLAVLVWLTTPWAYRIGIIAYTEGGLAAFLLIALIAALRAAEAWSVDRSLGLRWWFLAGLLAGAGPACKYPGAISVAIPMFVLMVWSTTRTAPLISPRPGTPGRGAGGEGPNVKTTLPTQSTRLPIDASLDSATGKSARPTESSRKSALTAITLFLTGGAIAFAPWLIKNLAETGNPFYPLMYSIFGGRDWDPASHAKWQAGHPLPLGTFGGPIGFLRDQAHRFLDIFLWNDWQTALAWAALPIAVAIWVAWRLLFNPASGDPAIGEARFSSRTILGILLLEVLWQFETWTLLTHRLDRFWVPMVPLLCWIAGIVCDQLIGSSLYRRDGAALVRTGVVGLVLAFVVTFNLGLVTSGICGNNAYLADGERLRLSSRNSTIAVLEDLPLPPDSKVLFVGEAEVFEAHFPNVYNTVFDRSIFQEWTSADLTAPDGEQTLRPPQQVRDALREHRITHIAVNWSEILRYRTTYRYTDYVHPKRFQQLVADGVLSQVSSTGTWTDFEKLAPERQQEIERFAPELLQRFDGKPILPGVQVYRVL